MHLRIATYNVHKCRGMDRRSLPARIASVIGSLDADIVGLQEILDVRNGPVHLDQARVVADGLPGYEWSFGENRPLHGGAYGNMTLSRRPILASTNLDLTHGERERRGCLRTDIALSPGITLHTLNLHMGTGFVERRHQVRRFLDLLGEQAWTAPRVLFGDFNEWTRGLASRQLSGHFSTVDAAAMLPGGRTYPGLFPLLHLDHFYFDPALALDRLQSVRTRETLVASDHLPLVADFTLTGTEPGARESMPRAPA